MTLVASLLVWAPSATACLTGDLPGDVALTRYAIAVLAAWIAISMLSRLVDAYAHSPGRRSGDKTAEGHGDLKPKPGDEPTPGSAGSDKPGEPTPG